MSVRRSMVIIAAVALVLSAAVAAAVSESDGVSSYTARVFVGDGTESGTTEYTGTGTDVEEILESALSSFGLEINPSGTVRSMNGQDNTDSNSWNIYQWRPPTGWVSLLANVTGDAYLENGTSYYVYYSDVSTSDGSTTYSKPSSFEPTSTAYFYIKFVSDSNANSYVTSVLTEEERLEGFWISGTGSDVAMAFINAVDTLVARGNTGFELVINDDRTDELYGWLGSFMGLEDEQISSEIWNYWSQFSWDSDTGSWEFNNYCLGYYDPGVTPYFCLVRQQTTEDNADSGVSVTPSDMTSNVRSDSCTVRFLDGDGNTIKTQTVRYFASATAPSTATKTAEGTTTYTFSGWDREFDQVISNITVTATFTSSSSDPGTDPDDDSGSTVPSSVSLSSSTLSLNVGASSTLTATVRPSTATDKSVTWSTSDRAVASVSSSGRVTALSAGTAIITVTTVVGGYTASCTVTVREDASAVTSIELEYTYAAMSVGGSMTLGVTVGPMTATDRSVTWSTSDSSIAIVDSSGNVSAVSEGKAVITARTSSGGLTATCTVEVLPDTGSASLNVDVDDDGSDSYTASVSVGGISGTDTEITVSTALGDVTLSSASVSYLGSGGSLSVTVAYYSTSDLLAAQKAAISTLEVEVTIYQYLIDGSDCDDLGGSATVRMPYALAEGSSASDVRVYSLATNGTLEAIPCTYSDGYVTFETTHFSLYFASTENLGSSEGDGGSDSDNTFTYIAIGAVVAVLIAIASYAIARKG